jgi:integrase
VSKNLYRRSGTWYARIEVNGREVRRSLHTTVEREARLRLKELLEHAGRARTGLTPKAEVVTWQDAVARWGTIKLPGLKPATKRRYLTSAAQLARHLEGRPIAAITQAVLNDYVVDRMEDGATPATVRRDLSVVSSVWRVAKRAGWVSGMNPALEELEEISEARHVIRPVRRIDLARVLRIAPTGIANIMRFLARAGCRLEEAASLEWPEVDLATRTVTFVDTKTRRPRAIEISVQCARELAGLKRHPKCAYVFWHAAGHQRGVPSRYHNLSPNIREAVLAAEREALARERGFRRFRAHDLRHTFAIRWLQKGGKLWPLSFHLGHTNIKTTEYYVQWLREHPRG